MIIKLVLAILVFGLGALVLLLSLAFAARCPVQTGAEFADETDATEIKPGTAWEANFEPEEGTIRAQASFKAASVFEEASEFPNSL
jgi:hypothetical protein